MLIPHPLNEYLHHCPVDMIMCDHVIMSIFAGRIKDRILEYCFVCVLCVCVCMCVYVCIHMCTCECECKCMDACMHSCARACTCVYLVTPRCTTYLDEN